MTRLNIAEWTYILGCASAVGSLLFRALFFVAKAPAVSICENLDLKPSSLLQFSVLCYVISLASRGW